jgi:DNA mismatch endonuclease (patch repair protein)
MRAVKSKHTSPELTVRGLLRKKKIKFKTYANLPGLPDIILSDKKTVIRVMGCFWHGHACKRGSRMPKTNVRYWSAKIARNKTRDKGNRAALKKLGWRVVDVWECRLKKADWAVKIVKKLNG